MEEEAKQEEEELRTNSTYEEARSFWQSPAGRKAIKDAKIRGWR